MINEEILNCIKVGGLKNHVCPNNNGSYLLPMAFPEGSPMHPAYGAGHATVAGACVTVLKAWFKDDVSLTNPGGNKIFKVFEASDDGLTLIEYHEADVDQLTVGSELNKLAANISIGRNAAGVHWRSDYSESIKLGETIAVGILQEQSLTYNELRIDGSPPYFEFTCFDGRLCRIEAGKVQYSVPAISRSAFVAPPGRGDPGEPTANIG